MAAAVECKEVVRSTAEKPSLKQWVGPELELVHWRRKTIVKAEAAWVDARQDSHTSLTTHKSRLRHGTRLEPAGCQARWLHVVLATVANITRVTSLCCSVRNIATGTQNTATELVRFSEKLSG